MQNDMTDQSLARLLKAARHAPPVGLEGRALAALTDIHPRRQPNLLTFIVVAALLLLLAAGVFAAVRYFFFVEGTLRFHDVSFAPDSERWDLRARLFSGELEWETEPRPSLYDGDISPDGDQVVFVRPAADGWPTTRADIVVANPDWSDEVNLTEIAGIGAVNCIPKWSPDGTMIAFTHCDPVEGKLPCDAGQYLWVMRADGSEAHQVTPEGAPPVYVGIAWSPDGSRLAACWNTESSEGEPVAGFDQPTDTAAFTTDIWGTDIRPLPNVGGEIAWSPDGSMFVSTETLPAELDGEQGAWKQLLLTDADGGHPRVLVEQFVSDADALAHWARHPDHPDHRDESEAMWMSDVQHWAGPCMPVWSPGSDQIAFLAAFPFDPDGLFFKDQIEVWVYDLNTDELIRVTHDDVGQISLSWK